MMGKEYDDIRDIEVGITIVEPEPRYEFLPLEDLDLAEITELLTKLNMSIDEITYNNCSLQLRRHFRSNLSDD